MELKRKYIIIIFLVALLGSGIGTFGVMEIRKNFGLANEGSVIVNQVSYENMTKGDYATAIAKAYDAVVEITSTVKTTNFFYGSSTGTSKGSGVIISADGYIVTNEHVIDNSKEVAVTVSSGESYTAEIIGYDDRADLALLKIDADNLQFANLADSDQLLLGQEAIVIGNPLGEGISCSNGIISALNKEVTISNYSMKLIQTNAAVNAGNSGGGLFNMNGDLIGIVNAKSSSNSFSSASVEGMGYAIPSNHVLEIITDLKEYGYVKNRATLGISIYTANNSYIQNNYNGLLVSAVQEGSGADKAGIEAGDIIFEVNGTQVVEYSDLTQILDSCKVGETVRVGVFRNNKTKYFDVVLSEASGN